MSRKGKRIRSAYEGIVRDKSYPLKDAIRLIKEKATAKFDETIEVSINLNIDVRKPNQNVRGMVQLPHGTGKTVRVAVFARGPKADEALNSGADKVGADDLIEQIQAGNIDFDRCIATPDMMVLVGKVAKVLGPKGLMPNPKLGTVTLDVAQAIKSLKGGAIEYRSEKAGIISSGVGRVSFSEEALLENIQALVGAVLKARPQGIKGTYLQKVSISSTMGPGIKVESGSFSVAT